MDQNGNVNEKGAMNIVMEPRGTQNDKQMKILFNGEGRGYQVG